MTTPYPLGSRVRHLLQTYGTAGCLGYFDAFPERILLLTASHVLAPSGVGANDPIFLNNASADIADPGAVAGRVYCWTGIRPDGTSADAALAWIDPASVSPDIPGIGRPSGVNEAPKVGDKLRFCGATSGTQDTEILAVGSDVTINVGPPDQPVAFTYTNQLLCRKVSQEGDSGAAVLDEQRRVVGLLVGWTTVEGCDVTVVSPIAAVRRHPQWNQQILNILGSIPADAQAPPTITQTAMVPVGDLETALDVLARTVWGEDRGGAIAGDPVAGMKAVACVVINRVRQQRRDWGLTVETVCQARKQFSVWNPKIPGYVASPNELAAYDGMMAATDRTPMFSQAMEVASAAIAGTLADPTGGATFYVATSFREGKCALSANAGQWYCKTDGVEIADQTYFTNVDT